MKTFVPMLLIIGLIGLFIWGVASQVTASSPVPYSIAGGEGCLNVTDQVYLPIIENEATGNKNIGAIENEYTVSPLAIAIPTCTPPLAAPTLLTPSDTATLAQTTFDWSDVDGATSYTIQLSDSAAFSSVTWQQTVTPSEYSYVNSLTGTYYWRVFAATPSLGIYSEVWSVNLVAYNNDDDNDSLPNGWELHGYDAGSNGSIDVDLPALGASYQHQDIFIEMDYMVRVSAANGLGPNQAVIDGIVAVFANAPVSNPDGVDGINIHLDLDEEVPYDNDLTPYNTEFYALKNTYFNANRAAVYHYMIWANGYNGGSSSGVSYSIPASDFIVTLGLWNGSNGGTDYQKIGTFIHELGHNLNLTHGGAGTGLAVHDNYKPNYLSVMNYSFQTTGVYRNGSLYNFDYQRFALPALDETNLNESVGLNSALDNNYATRHYCPNGSSRFAYNLDAIDWNCDSDTTDSGLGVNINNNNPAYFPYQPELGTLETQNNWANIVFHGGGVIGSGLEPEQIFRGIEDNFVDLQLDELTYEENFEIERAIEEEFGPIQYGPTE